MIQQTEKISPLANRLATLFLCGDVMTGRGVDQILSHPGDPTLHESAVKDARVYVELAERHSGPIPRGGEAESIWGDALDVLRDVSPDLRIINLETAVTTSDEYWPGKQVHYRMNPRNTRCLTAANIDCCVLANNHVLDWGYAGFEETLRTLENAGIATAGAGRDLEQARRPAVFELPQGNRVLVFGMGSPSSGIPHAWAAAQDQPGVHLIDESSAEAEVQVQPLIERFKRPGDLVVLSIHWGPNWGYEIPWAQRRFAHELIEHAGVDIVHGHSSHHVKGVEVYRNRPILYGCGDFLTDYEGIRSHEAFRNDLGLMYFVSMDADTHELAKLELRPTQVKQMRLNRASPSDAVWLAELLCGEGRMLHSHVEQTDHQWLSLRWD